MSCKTVARQIHAKAVSEVRNVAVSFKSVLDDGELLTGTPTVVEVTTSDLTLDNKVVSAAQLTIGGETVAIGQAVQFRASGGTAGVRYTIRVTCGTDATPAQTIATNLLLDVVED